MVETSIVSRYIEQHYSSFYNKSIMTEQEQPKINYPCPWQYKLIGNDINSIKQAIIDIIADHEHTVAHSNTSSSGKYISLNLELEVHSEEHRDLFFFKFREHIDIKFVI